jgi:hypothetical protein
MQASSYPSFSRIEKKGYTTQETRIKASTYEPTCHFLGSTLLSNVARIKLTIKWLTKVIPQNYLKIAFFLVRFFFKSILQNLIVQMFLELSY